MLQSRPSLTPSARRRLRGAGRTGTAFAIVLGLAGAALGGAGPAAAFDSEPHGDITVDALQAEGFGLPAAKVAWVANYFVDFYSQASNNPYSGHATKKVAAAAQPIDPFEYENWSPAVMHAAAFSHFDGTDRPGGFPDTAAVTAEWDRLRRATFNLVRAAKANRSELDLLETIGMSLHQLQDFYAHGNWVERPGDRGSEPGWDPVVEGSVPTWFDVPPERRGDAYTSASTGHRNHGTWQQDGNLNLLNGLNKDWPGRPRYTEAYMTSYFATRQWVQAIRSWLSDPVLWNKAKAFAKEQRQVQQDIDGNVIAVSQTTGHWSGEGGPCQPDVSFDSGPSCGQGEGKGGTLLGARSAIKDYHGDHDRRCSAKRSSGSSPASSWTRGRHRGGGPRTLTSPAAAGGDALRPAALHAREGRRAVWGPVADRWRGPLREGTDRRAGLPVRLSSTTRTTSASRGRTRRSRSCERSRGTRGSRRRSRGSR